MKKSFYLFSAFVASMAMASCSNNDEPALQGDTMPKSVAIDLTNVIASRSAGQSIADETPVSLADLQVFFTDGTDLFNGKTAEGTDATHYFSTKSEFDNRTDAVFHFLPANVNKVIVIGNNGSELTPASYAALAQDLAIADQQNATDLDLYKEVDLTSPTGEDPEGHPLYKVDVELEPRVSRIEISGFEYKEIEGQARLYESIKIDQVVLGNFYPTADSQTGNAEGDIVYPKADTDEGTIYGIFEGAAAANAWYSDVFSAEQDVDETKELPVVTLDNAANYVHTYAEGNVLPAYHFFPDATNISSTDHPQLLVKMIGTQADGTTVPLYLVTQKFTPAVTSDMAKIYEVDFEFDDNDLGNPEKCIDVTVTVKNWDVVSVTPEF